MAEGFDERGEPIGTMPVEEPVPQAQPVAPPQAVPAGAPFISPSFAGRTDVMPGPRGGMVVPQGGGTVGLTPDSQAEMTGFLEQAAKAGRLDKAQKDVDQAMRFLGMRGVEKDVEKGTPYPQALAKHLPFLSWNDPTKAAAYSRVIAASQPPAPLSMQTLDGVRVLRTPRGDRIVPQSAIPQPPVTSAQTIPLTDPQTGEPVAGHFAVPGATGKGFTVHRRADQEPRLTPAQQRLQLNDLIKEKRAEIDDMPYPAKGSKEAQAAAQLEIGRLNTELKELKSQRQSPTKKAQGGEDSKGQPVPPKDKRVIGQVYELPSGPHRWASEDGKIGWVKP